MRVRELATPRGPARVTLHCPPGPPAALAVLLHGAGTDTGRAPLPALADELAAAGVLAVRFDQPYVLGAGRRPPPPAAHLDEALLAALPALRTLAPDVALGIAGRSSGARVACRTAGAAGAVAVLALGFPWQPPGGARPPRAADLRAGGAACPVLVVQGDRDPFGRPGRTRGVRVRLVPELGHLPDEAAARIGARWLIGRLLGPAGGNTRPESRC